MDSKPSARAPRLLLPFSLTALILLLDQVTKALVVARVQRGYIGFALGGDLFWVIHARNPAIAFSLGSGLPPVLRTILFVSLPLVLLTLILVFYFRNSRLGAIQRWAVCGIVGGGLGNLVDRIFRPDGVVDFLSVKFFGLLGLDRWPTFNVADSSVVVCGIVLAITLLFEERKQPA